MDDCSAKLLTELVPLAQTIFGRRLQILKYPTSRESKSSFSSANSLTGASRAEWIVCFCRIAPSAGFTIFIPALRQSSLHRNCGIGLTSLGAATAIFNSHCHPYEAASYQEITYLSRKKSLNLFIITQLEYPVLVSRLTLELFKKPAS